MNLEIVNLELKLINFNFICHACFLCCEPNLGLAAKGGHDDKGNGFGMRPMHPLIPIQV